MGCYRALLLLAGVAMLAQCHAKSLKEGKRPKNTERLEELLKLLKSHTTKSQRTSMPYFQSDYNGYYSSYYPSYSSYYPSYSSGSYSSYYPSEPWSSYYPSYSGYDSYGSNWMGSDAGSDARFICSTGQTIPSQYVCDHDYDCLMGEDEENCTASGDWYVSNYNGGNYYGSDFQGSDTYGSDYYGSDFYGSNYYGSDYYGSDYYPFGSDYYPSWSNGGYDSWSDGGWSDGGYPDYQDGQVCLPMWLLENVGNMLSEYATFSGSGADSYYEFIGSGADSYYDYSGYGMKQSKTEQKTKNADLNEKKSLLRSDQLKKVLLHKTNLAQKKMSSQKKPGRLPSKKV